jgi:hypothetical protein
VKLTEVVPILNVSNVAASVEWFAQLGWTEGFIWCPPDQQEPTFAGVTAGDFQIFLCLDGQGGRGEHAAWIALWVDDVDEVARVCERQGCEIVSGPEDKPWGVCELHVRHPDGHVLRISKMLEHDHEH